MYVSIHAVTLLHVSNSKGPSSKSTDTFHEQGQQNSCPDVHIRLKNGVWFVMWQLSNLQLCSDVNVRLRSRMLGVAWQSSTVMQHTTRCCLI